MNPSTVRLILSMIAFIKAYQKEYLTSPSQLEIAEAVGRKPSTIPSLFAKAESMGMIKRDYGARRNIEVL